MAIVRWAGNSFRFSTGEVIQTNQWDKKKQQCALRGGADALATNAVLQRVKSDVVSNFNEFKLQNGRVPTVDELKSTFKKDKRPTAPFEFFKAHVVKMTREMNPRTGKISVLGTRKHYNQVVNRFDNFQKSINRKITWKEIDLKFYRDFTTFCSEIPLSLNSVGATIKAIKVMLREADAAGYDVNPAYRSSAFKKITESSSRIALTIEDIQSLLLCVPSTPRLEELRDIFIFSCFTALRYRDWEKIPEMMRKSTGVVELSRQYKTSKPALIPVRKNMLPFAEKFARGFVHHRNFNSTVVVNRELKKVAFEAGLIEPIRQEITRGGVRVVTHVEKWKLVSTHTARRTFATLTYKSGYDAQSLSKLMGLHNENELRTYLKLGPVEEANRLRDHWDKLDA